MEKPKWIDYTPDECSYHLVMYDNSGGSVQTVDTSREEFIALKEHLRDLRELKPEAPPET